MKFPIAINNILSKNNLSQKENLIDFVIYLRQESKIECECKTKIQIDRENITVLSMYHKIYIKTKTFELDNTIRKLRNLLRNKYKEINENLFEDESLYIELCICPKTRDSNGVIIEKLYNSMFVLVYSKYDKSCISFEEIKANSNQVLECEEDITDDNFLYNYFDIDKTLKNQIDILTQKKLHYNI